MFVHSNRNISITLLLNLLLKFMFCWPKIYVSVSSIEPTPVNVGAA